ncbi:SMI1/KNR4 family protein [Xylocopilactobacillus apicola]|uniref:Knr4/Smi1-like domain-containing protein n=1 Tax=Xylocopilactobacillus apicola TaxID=2932184 RepID=A0AAU9CZ06_9LACO|nr:SMI1/KNR4 family protein [Xylocopilactobacillus apicola]BDR57651.1 hypothetical protein XA3_00920 [Xylocopilactobacillus apicola]
MNILNTNGVISEKDIENFEKKIGRILPKEYRDFLKEYNGGTLESKNVFCFYDKNREKKDKSTLRLLGYLGKKNRSDTDHLSYLYGMFSQRMPKGYIPIGRDPGGNLILINLDSGKIYFWDHEFEPEEDELDTRNIYYINDGFNDFIECLE